MRGDHFRSRSHSPKAFVGLAFLRLYIDVL